LRVSSTRSLRASTFGHAAVKPIADGVFVYDDGDCDRVTMTMTMAAAAAVAMLANRLRVYRRDSAAQTFTRP
jgi:hypothetical protein